MSMDSIDTICDNLEKAFADQKNDPVSLVTIIDMYIDQLDADYTTVDKVQYLNKLHELLLAHPEIVRQIGWDLPKGLLKFYSRRNVDPNSGLRYNAVVVVIMKCFNEVALHGNPKECLLIGCQLLSELSTGQIEEELKAHEATEEESEDNSPLKPDITAHSEIASPDSKVFNHDPIEFFIGLKTYVLFELIQTVLRRISTLYPSKFLGMAVSAICKFLRTNVDDFENVTFILRRIFTFCRNYTPTIVPPDVENSGELSKEEIRKISSDESVLQGKILRSLCTFAIGYCLKTKHPRIDVQYFCSFTDSTFTQTPYMKEISEICSRYYQLAYSFDIDLKQEFSNVIKESRDIYKSLPPDSELANDEARRAIGQVVYQLSYTYQLQRMAKAKELELDPFGIVVLSGLNYEVTKKHLCPELDIQDAIYLYLRFSTPLMFSDLYSSSATEEVCRYWLWVSITNSSYKTLKKHLSELPSYINCVLLQLLLLRNCGAVNEQVRMVTFTLLTRLLCLMPEEISFSFSLDTLLTCPYIQPKICMLGILKDLMLRTCQCKPSLTMQMKKLNLESEESESGKNAAPPSLPPRPFISLNSDRMASLHSVAMIATENAAKQAANKEELLLLLNYLNFFIALRDKWDKNLLNAIYLEASSHFNDETEETTPEIGFIKIANKTLGKHL